MDGVSHVESGDGQDPSDVATRRVEEPNSSRDKTGSTSGCYPERLQKRGETWIHRIRENLSSNVVTGGTKVEVVLP